MTGSTDCGCITDAGSMNLTQLDICESATATATHNMDSTLDANDLFSYYLHTSSVDTLGTIIATSTTPSFTFNSGTMTFGTTYYISSVAGDDNGGIILLTDPCLDVSEGTPVVFYEEPEATLSGGGEICLGDSLILTINLTPATDTFDVVYSIEGVNQATLTGIQNGYTIKVEPTAASTDYQLVSVQRSSAPTCAGTVDTDAETVIVNGSPSVSNIQETCNSTATGYVVSFDISGGDNTSYQELSSQGTITGNVFTSDLITSGDTFNFQIVDANMCDTVIVAGRKLCNCVTDAGSMNLTQLDICESTTAVATHNADSTLDGNDLFLYYLHTNSTNSLGTVIATNDSAVFNFDAGTMSFGTTYYISSVAGDDNGSGSILLSDPCLDVSQGTPVVFYEEPTAILSGGATICEGETVSLIISLTPSNGIFDVVYSIDGVNQTQLTSISDSFALVASPTAASTDYQLVSVQRSNAPTCAGTVGNNVETIVVNGSPSVSNIQETCNATATGYIVTFEISGGDITSYQELASQGTIVANIFTSDLITSGDTYSFSILDANGCDTILVTGSKTCDCITDAGSMNLTALDLCESETATATHNADSTLDGNDLFLYYLHTNSTNSLGTVIATNDSAVFNFDVATMSYGTTYYISSVAGDNNGGSVLLTDPCLDVSQGTPVVFYEEPTATISGGGTICEGESITVTFNATPSTELLNLVYNINGTPQSLTITNGTASVTTSPSADATYTLNEISRNGSPACAVTLNSSINVVVNEYPEIQVISNDTIICLGNSADLSVQYTPTAAVASWSYSQSQSGGYSTIASTNIATASEEGFYRVELDNQGCKTTSDPISVQTEDVQIQATANPDVLLIGEESTISAIGSSQYIYEWESDRDNTVLQGQSHVVSPDNTTVYTVTAFSNLNNTCFDQDMVSITVYPPVTIPNGFSPNGDNKNDFWFVKGLELYPDAEIQIYNRWGSVVYLHEGVYDEPWDGKNSNGDELPFATYYYVIKLNDVDDQEFAGSVTIIK